ncbi:cobalamin biosynthesis protein [Acidiferrimicrobium sp. IK]|uniref:cobalamin biosynthesis protein n=1 Tax=Acidiferrimicrobium sp. IK TaxID=2871700 RepID=UPI0021CB4073|nr:cobalamin biosynthesis protein [Acidiferrimicrobium sp. IK]MCU4187445.1 cobalamin biosynthesis protein [Acidiferrimicrobium sp. IK]
MAAYLGIGASSGASASDIRCLADEVLAAGGVGWSAVDAVATSAGLASDPRLHALGRPVVGFAVAELGAVAGTHPSPRALREVGTPSVAEAAALLAAGPGARLAVPKRRAARVTAALACR